MLRLKGVKGKESTTGIIGSREVIELLFQFQLGSHEMAQF